MARRWVLPRSFTERCGALDPAEGGSGARLPLRAAEYVDLNSASIVVRIPDKNMLYVRHARTRHHIELVQRAFEHAPLSRDLLARAALVEDREIVQSDTEVATMRLWHVHMHTVCDVRVVLAQRISSLHARLALYDVLLWTKR